MITSGQILLAELAEKLWRDLAAVPASCICEPTHTQPSPASTPLAVTVIQCVCDKQKPSTRQTNQTEKKEC